MRAEEGTTVMASWLASGWTALGAVAGKAGLMYLTALVGLRLVHR